MALFRGLARLLLESDDRAPGTVVDRPFIDTHCHGFDDYAALARAVDLDTVLDATGITADQLHRVAGLMAASRRTIVCWAMGLTQHTHAVATIAEITNVLLLRGMIGKPGAGLCPVRGHSNVQGDRTMGIWEKAPESFLAALDSRFGISVPRRHGHDTVNAIRAMRDGRASVFIGMGGNFASATPDTAVTTDALRNCALTVQVSTKLNRSHLVGGRTALILPTLGRTDRDLVDGRKQVVSVEDSMSMVHLSRGSLPPPGEQVRSEVAIICQLARRLLGSSHPVPWERFAQNYDTIRDEPGAPTGRIPTAAPAPRCPRIPDRHRQSQFRQLPTALGARSPGPVGAADTPQPRPVQHHHLRPRRPLPRCQGRPPGGLRQPVGHRRPRPDRR
jgi:molybdopterin-dependent oxidoreductase alpha subunit